MKSRDKLKCPGWKLKERHSTFSPTQHKFSYSKIINSDIEQCTEAIGGELRSPGTYPSALAGN